MKRIFTKKFTLLASVFVMVFVFASCGANGDDWQTEQQAQPEAHEVHEAQAAQSQDVEQDMAQTQVPQEQQEQQEEQAVQQEAEVETPDQPRAEYIRISPEEAERMMMNEDVVILDVRTQGEFDSGHIPGAILLPDFEVGERAFELIPNLDQIILVYCRAGSRSANASRELIDLGYTRVYDFGGIMDWHGTIIG